MTRNAARRVLTWLDFHFGCSPPDVTLATPTTHDRRHAHG